LLLVVAVMAVVVGKGCSDDVLRLTNVSVVLLISSTHTYICVSRDWASDCIEAGLSDSSQRPSEDYSDRMVDAVASHIPDVCDATAPWRAISIVLMKVRIVWGSGASHCAG
jgi:hypothetical protein